MPQADALTKRNARRDGGTRDKVRQANAETRYTVALPSGLAHQVEQYAETVDASKSKAIAALVRLGLESQQHRKREFFKKLKENLADDNPNQEDRLVEEFRALILGR
jgi:hypothetical protein